MSYHPDDTMKRRWFSRSVFALLALLAVDQTAEAGLTLLSSSGSTSYSVFATTTPTSNSAAYKQIANSDGTMSNTVLLSPGNGLPTLVPPSTSSLSFSASTLSPYFLSSVTNGANNFGSATTEVYASTSGQQGSFTSQGGVYWSLKTNLSDSIPAGTNAASVSFSIATATYQNLTSSAMTFTPGAIMSISGTLGGPSSYIAAGLATTISTTDGESVSTTVLDTITLAANGTGATIAAYGHGTNEAASVTAYNNTVSGTGTSLDPNTVTLNPYSSITITSYLTLISDPGSSIGITNTLAPGFPSGSQYLPDFGSFASSQTMVPEPSSIILLGSGLATTGLWLRKRNRPRNPTV